MDAFLRLSKTWQPWSDLFVALCTLSFFLSTPFAPPPPPPPPPLFLVLVDDNRCLLLTGEEEEGEGEENLDIIFLQKKKKLCANITNFTHFPGQEMLFLSHLCVCESFLGLIWHQRFFWNVGFVAEKKKPKAYNGRREEKKKVPVILSDHRFMCVSLLQDNRPFPKKKNFLESLWILNLLRGKRPLEDGVRWGRRGNWM